MAREFASVNLSIWQDDDYRALPPSAQHLYYVLWTHPLLSYCGVTDWRPGKLSALSAGWTTGAVEAASACLQSRYFIVIDEVTEEVLIRSWVRFDGLLKQPRLSVSFANAFAGVASNTLRGVIVDEALKLQEMQPDLIGWTKPQVKEIVARARVSAKSLPVPDDPFGDGFGDSLALGLPIGLGQTLPNVSGSVSVPPTPAPTPAPSHQHHDTQTPSESGGTRKRAHQLPDGWTPDPTVIEQMRSECPGIDLQAEHRKFTDHWRGNGKPMKDWNATWRNWIRRAGQFTSNNKSRPGDIDWDAAMNRARQRDERESA